MAKTKFDIQWWPHIRQWVVCVSVNQTRIQERYYYAKSKSDAIAAKIRMEAKENDVPKYTVEVSEIWKRTFVVELPEIEAVKALVGGESLVNRIRAKANEMSGEGADDQGFEYSDTLEPEEWLVRTEDGEFVV